MKKMLIMLLASVLLIHSAKAKPLQKSLKEVINTALEFSTKQSLLMAKSLENKPAELPRTTNTFGNLITCKPNNWVSGFFPGVLWYLYENKPSEELKTLAVNYTHRIENQQFTTSTHDVGFIIFCSFGNQYRILNDTSCLPVILNASISLSTRYNPSVGLIRSWNSVKWKYPVIIDNMMNLEMLMWASQQYNQPEFAQIAISHAKKTALNHFRPDNSCYHVVNYNPETGNVDSKTTHQGYANESSWARGQGWALYGYTMMYRFTKDSTFLNKACAVATYLLNHPRLPEDKIPYWDFDAPNIPDTYRDASAGAVICSALIELSGYVDKNKSRKYLAVAEKQIRALSSPAYSNAADNNGNFILKHSVGAMPQNSEIDVPLSYADYYYVEALMRFRTIINN
ncbi:MAG: glycoside hydrolase family 88 protein [Paludibacter sp.]|nr:glycoside hydrolase family 88 protein [Paludibacter sp.]